LKLYKERDNKLIRNIEPIRFNDEVGEFHKYFQENVQAILGLEENPKKVLHHEGIEGKEIDFLIVDNLDRVYFIEIKLGKNPENRREVISQIIDYWSRCRSYISTMEKLPKKARDAIEKGYVNPVIITDELLDDHRYILPNVKLGQNNIRIRLIEIKRWEKDGEVFVTANTVNNQEPIAFPTRKPPRTKEELLSMIEDNGLQAFARNLDRLFQKHKFIIKQKSKSRLAYTRGQYNRLFVFVCTNPVWGDQIGDFVVTTEYRNIGISEDLWEHCNIKRSGRTDDWGGEIYELAKASQLERKEFLEFLAKVLIEFNKYLDTVSK